MHERIYGKEIVVSVPGHAGKSLTQIPGNRHKQPGKIFRAIRIPYPD